MRALRFFGVSQTGPFQSHERRKKIVVFLSKKWKYSKVNNMPKISKHILLEKEQRITEFYLQVTVSVARNMFFHLTKSYNYLPFGPIILLS